MILKNYERACSTVSDINEHLPTLRAYAAKCSSVAEMGVRSVVSTWAFLQGLVDSSSPTKSLQCLDLADVPSMAMICREVKQAKIDMCFIQGDSAKTPIKPVDLLFIDTWHVYGHLKRELEFHHAKVAKYIIMHDTTLDALVGESIRAGWNTAQQAASSGYPESEIRRGLKPAIDEFLAAHPEWTVKEVFTNNNGLTVLQRV